MFPIWSSSVTDFNEENWTQFFQLWDCWLGSLIYPQSELLYFHSLGETKYDILKSQYARLFVGYHIPTAEFLEASENELNSIDYE